MPSISYAITTCNEYNELSKLLDQLSQMKQPQDEIIVQLDFKEGSENMIDLINKYIEKSIVDKILIYSLNKNFAQFKNNIKNHCKKDYIFFIDADELLSSNLEINLHLILKMNKDVELFFIPRENKVSGITEEYIKQQGWIIDSEEKINFPDNQGRIIKNKSNINWEGKVHEKIVGAKIYSYFPSILRLIHHKTFEKQQKQNNFYSQI
jgi:glycosyltransferase involved in cell wall biosynthesis